MDIREHNRKAWDGYVANGNPWTQPVSPEVVKDARQGEWSILLTPTKPVPRQWFPPLTGTPVLCLASGGGQQGPILAAAGAQVTVLDNSPSQLAQDRMVADREGLDLTTIEGDMRDLSGFAEGQFILIVHPISNLFIPNVRPVWQESFRVLRPGGVLLAGFMNPAHYIFDFELMESQGILEVKYSVPYSDLTSTSPELRQRYIEEGFAMEFGHTLEDQIGGQLEAGFLLAGFYEDIDSDTPLAKVFPSYIATRAIKSQPPQS